MTTNSNITPWGFHAILDCSNSDAAAIQSESTIRSWLAEVATVVSTSAVGEPQLAITGEGDANKHGFSAVQLLNIGSIVINCVNNSKHIYIDIFSCQEFTLQAVEDIIKNYFGNSIEINKILLPRNASVRPPQ
jgi:S-adenosylmethionine/arginine decarboxylase-like enzyme